jgi:uncharacterized damage-inducible protein DinB
VNIQDLLLLFDYNYWANDRVARTATRAGPDVFVASAPQAYGSLRGTLLHIVDGELAWRTLFETGSPPADTLKEADFPTLESVERRRRDEEAAMRRYLGSLGDGDLARILRYTGDAGVPRARVLWHCLVHVVNHGTHHRSQAAAILRGHGHSPGDLDLTVYLLERN